jgi:hypothetical protein
VSCLGLVKLKRTHSNIVCFVSCHQDSYWCYHFILCLAVEARNGGVVKLSSVFSDVEVGYCSAHCRKEFCFNILLGNKLVANSVYYFYNLFVI